MEYLKRDCQARTAPEIFRNQQPYPWLTIQRTLSFSLSCKARLTKPPFTASRPSFIFADIRMALRLAGLFGFAAALRRCAQDRHASVLFQLRKLAAGMGWTDADP